MDKHNPPKYDVDGFARLDHHREMRQGMPELVYAEGKTAEQVAHIMHALYDRQGYALASRADLNHAEAVRARLNGARYNPTSHLLTIGEMPKQKYGQTLVVAAGTSDLPVAEEACGVLAFLGNEVSRLYDVGVAGVHRLLDQIDTLSQADVVIVVAGMEGALPTLVGGLVAVPVIAVPTSVGYGASFNGLSALLGMLNSCASGVTVVNIDNGLGAAAAAHRILQHTRSRFPSNDER